MRLLRDPLARPLAFIRKAGMRGGAICRLSGSCKALPTAMHVSFGEVMWLGKNTRRRMKPAECGAYWIDRTRSVSETEGSEAESRTAASGSNARCLSSGALLCGSVLGIDAAVGAGSVEAGSVGQRG
jgi:hypothetical protein